MHVLIVSAGDPTSMHPKRDYRAAARQALAAAKRNPSQRLVETRPARRSGTTLHVPLGDRALAAAGVASVRRVTHD